MYLFTACLNVPAASGRPLPVPERKQGSALLDAPLYADLARWGVYNVMAFFWRASLASSRVNWAPQVEQL